jgi:hypothetical protein
LKQSSFAFKGYLWKAICLYDLAIDNAKQNGFIQNAAIANELAGIMLLDAGHLKLAFPYFHGLFQFI